MRSTISVIVFMLMAQAAFPQYKGSFGRTNNDDFEQIRNNSNETKSIQDKGLEAYILELFPGQVFNGWYYFWSNSGSSTGNLKENPEVGWLSITPNKFTSTGCTNIIPVKFSFIAPMGEGVYVSNVIDSTGTWDTLRVELRVTKSPENYIIKRFGINQDSISFKSYLKNTPFNWVDNTCIKDYFPGDTIEYNYNIDPDVNWLKISPSSGKAFRNEMQSLQTTLQKNIFDSTRVTLERNYYSNPTFYHYYVKETEPKEYLLQFNGENLISTGYFPSASTKTLMFWVRFDTITNQAIGVHDGENHRFYLGISKDNTLFAGMGDSYTPLTSLNLIPGKWYNMAMSARNDSAFVYINATEVSRWKYSFSGESKANLYIAARNDFTTYGYFIKGLIDEVQVWELPLSRNGIIKYMFSPPEGNENGLVIYYPFNEGWGDFTKNSVDNYFYGNLYKEPQWIDYIERPNDPSIIITVNGGGTTSHVAPMPPILKWPGDKTSDISINPFLEWVSKSSLLYHLQVSLSSDFSDTSTLVLDQSKITSNPFPLSNLANNTTYYWRVNCKNSDGISSWSNIWKFITSNIPNASPPRPTLHQPANGAIGVRTNDPLYWNYTSGASSYRLQVSLSSDFTTTVIDQSNVTRIPFLLPFLDRFDTDYYWRVKAANPFGTSDWSDTWKFTTETLLLTPANNATCIPINPTLNWNNVPGATSYHLQVSLSSEFTTFVLDQSNIVGSSYSLTNLSNNTTYYWRVNCTNPSGTLSWSNTWKFTVFVIPSPNPLTPVNNARDILPINPVTFNWESVPGATSYHLQVSLSSEFTTFVLDQSHIVDSSYSLTNLKYSTNYHWQVNATNTLCTSDWSDPMYFATIIAPPSKPKLEYPFNDQQEVWIVDFLHWEREYACSYRLQVSISADFTTIVFDQSNLTDYSFQIVPYIFSVNTVYYWRVNATNKNGTSDWSDTWKFTTTKYPPSQPIAVHPRSFHLFDNAFINDTLIWVASYRASSYRLQVSQSRDFTTTVIDQSNIPNNPRYIGNLLPEEWQDSRLGIRFLLPNLNYNTTYYWRVKAINPIGMSDWSYIEKFKTWTDNLSKPILLSPHDNTIGSPAACEYLQWTELDYECSQDITSYRVQVSLSPDFTKKVLDYSWTFYFDYSEPVRNLSFNTTYYWRVNYTNPYCTSDWSDTWKFTTEDLAPLSPPDNGTKMTINPVLIWSSAGPRAISYNLQVWTDAKDTVMIIDQPYIMSNSYSLTNLNYNTTYYWRVKYITINSDSSYWSDTWKFTTETVTDVEPILSYSSIYLKQNYPNPFTHLTKIEFNIPIPGHVEIAIYNVLGIKINTLLNKYLEPDLYSVDWIPQSSIKSGIYYCQLRVGGIIKTKIMIYNK